MPRNTFLYTSLVWMVKIFFMRGSVNFIGVCEKVIKICEKSISDYEKLLKIV